MTNRELLMQNLENLKSLYEDHPPMYTERGKYTCIPLTVALRMNPHTDVTITKEILKCSGKCTKCIFNVEFEGTKKLLNELKLEDMLDGEA